LKNNQRVAKNIAIY